MESLHELFASGVCPTIIRFIYKIFPQLWKRAKDTCTWLLSGIYSHIDAPVFWSVRINIRRDLYTFYDFFSCQLKVIQRHTFQSISGHGSCDPSGSCGKLVFWQSRNEFLHSHFLERSAFIPFFGLRHAAADQNGQQRDQDLILIDDPPRVEINYSCPTAKRWWWRLLY